MRLWTPNPTPIRAAFRAAVLRGGAVDGRRNASPPGSGSGAAGAKADGRLTSAEGPRVYNCGPAAQRPSGMKCARRLAGGRRSALSASADSPRRPEPRPGRSRARFSFLPALALLLGALSLFHAAPAAAQTTVTLSVSPNPVTEGGSVSVIATLSATPSQSVTIPITVTLVSAETGDFRLVGGLAGLRAGFIFASGVTTKFYGLATAQDTDSQDETFTVALGTLPTGYTAGTTSSVTVTIQDDDPPPAPIGLEVEEGYRQLGLFWTAPSATVTGYHVHFTSATASSVANNAAASGTAPATAWVDVGSGNAYTGTAVAIPNLTNGTAYRVRVRAVNAAGNSAWVFGWGRANHHGPTPGKPVVTAVEAATGARTLSFSIPCVTPGSGHVTNYQVGVKKSDGSDSEDFSTHEFTLAEYNANRSCPTTTVRLMGLTPGTAYTFRARARNIFGRRGKWSDPVESTTDALQMFLGGGGKDPDRKEALTASFEQVPAAHDGEETFDLLVRLSETIGNFSKSPRASSFEVTQGSVVMVEQAGAGLWRVRVRPSSSSQVSVTLAGGRDCDTEGAVCTRDIRALSNTVTATVDGPTRIQVERTPAQKESEPQPQKAAQQEEESAQQQQQRLDPLTAALENVPSGHDGGAAFAIDLRFSEALDGGGVAPSAASFRVQAGSVAGVERVSAGLWRVRVQPKNWKDVTVTLAPPVDCAAAGAVCASGGRALSNAPAATVGGPVRIRVEGAGAKEGKDKTLVFAVTLNRAAAHQVSVDYETADETATAGADYTATSGTLTFATGETVKTVSVPVLDDAVDEGKETMRLLLTNPQGAYLRNSHRQAKGVIRNTDPLPKAYLGYFGRRAASDAVAAVTARFETPRGAGSHFTFAGQRLSGDGAALADTVAGLARAFGAEEATAAPGGDPFARHGLGDPWNDAASAPGRAMSARELLMGMSFRAVLGGGAGSQLTSWGQGASVSHFSGAAPGLSLSGEAATGALGMDYERGRLLTGFALTHSLGAGTAHGAGETYALGSSVTTVLPYARFALTERISAWTLAGTGSGGLTLDVDDDAAQRHRTDLSMTLAAAGVRGDLVTPVEAGGFALALKADAFWVRTESESVRAPGAGSLAAARADATRLRAVLDGKRTFALAGGATLAPSLELGVRHDGGDAGTGTGVELGAGVGFTDPSRGLDMALRVYGLAAHAEDRHREWGVSGSVSLVPGGSGRGLSMSLTPSYGVDRGDAQRLWTMPDAHALAANDEAATASSRLDTELGYGLVVFGGGFTGTPNVGFGLSDGGGRDYRLGWRLTPAASGDTGFEVSLDATRREAANDEAEHGVMLRGLMRW